MRPRGEVRAALMKAAEQLLSKLDRVTYRDIAAAARVGYEVARSVIKEMVRAGELKPVGSMQVPGIRRPLSVYALGSPRCDQSSDAAAILSRWPAIQ